MRIAEGRFATRPSQAAVLDTLLKLLHPVMPFVTETLWKALTGGGESVSPTGRNLRDGADHAAAQRVADLQKLVTEIRRFRSDQGLADRQKVPARLTGVEPAAWPVTFPR